MTDSRTRKYQLTINNPIDKGYDHEKIRNILDNSKPKYYCLCDETGENGTPHTHIYVYYENAVYFSTIKKRFSEAHIEKAEGTSQQNRDYIRKEGAYLESEKKETNHIETFEEYGEMPQDKATKNSKVIDDVYEMICDGANIAEIIEKYPSCGYHISQIEKMIQTYRENKYMNVWRDVDVQYIFGETGTGKTRYVMDTFGYSNVYKVTNYIHPFDGYNGQDILLLDEFRSSLQISDLLQYLDGYPCKLPARYAEKVACYTKVFIISNIDLKEQYPNIQMEQPKTWDALIRRINGVTHYQRNTNKEIFGNYEIIKSSIIPSDYYLQDGDGIV